MEKTDAPNTYLGGDLRPKGDSGLLPEFNFYGLMRLIIAGMLRRLKKVFEGLQTEDYLRLQPTAILVLRKKLPPFF